MTDNRRPRGGKAAWQPSNQAKQLLAATAGKLISLPNGERQWVLQQLMIFNNKPKKAQKAKKASSKKKTPKEKSDWKKEWHATDAYKRWQAAVTPKGQPIPKDEESQAKFVELRNHAFRERDAIKAKHSQKNASPNAESKTPAPAPAEQEPENEIVDRDVPLEGGGQQKSGISMLPKRKKKKPRGKIKIRQDLFDRTDPEFD